MNPGLFELLAASAGLMGTLLLAFKSRASGWGFVLYLVSNVAWIGFAMEHGFWALAVQHAGFLITSVIGIWMWLVVPFVQARHRAAMELLAMEVER